VNRPVLVLAMLSALCFGAALGFAGGVLFSTRHLPFGPGRPPFALHERGPGSMPPMPPTRVILPWLQRRLSLRPEQVEAIRAEIARSRDELGAVHDSVHARIERHLDAQQRERFRRLLAERFPGDHRGRGSRRLRAVPEPEGEPK
jgi:hypothetical protein